MRSLAVTARAEIFQPRDAAFGVGESCSSDSQLDAIERPQRSNPCPWGRSALTEKLGDLHSYPTFEAEGASGRSSSAVLRPASDR
jgi:hypothetical protein